MKEKRTPEEILTQAVLEAAEQAQTECGCRMTRLMQNVRTQGASAYLKMLLARHRRSDEFDRLADEGRLELSMEAIAVKSCFGSLFTDEEINACLSVLLENGYFG